MKKFILLFIIILPIFSVLMFNNGFAQLNIIFKSKLTFPGKQLSNIWGYAASGKEYALVGHSAGMSVVDVTNPANPLPLFQAPGLNSIWREVRTKGTYAFVTTEAQGSGLQIVNLQYLPDSIQYKSWTGSGAIAGQLSSIHALQVDGNYLYLYGSNIDNAQGSGHPLIIDVTDPWNPQYVGECVYPGSGNISYVHDGIVRNDTAYFGHIYNGFFSIWDVTNKSNPVLLASQNTPNNFTHNTWLSDNGKTLFTTDEVDNSFLASYDVSDPSDIKFLDKVQQNPGSNSVVHNTYVLNDYAVTSWYKEGVVITDGSRPQNLIITGNYDTSPMSGSGMDGDWGVYAFLPSGNLLCSDMQEGMFVLAPTYVRGCYLEGMVTDSVCGNPINGVTISIDGSAYSENTDLSGNYAFGTPAAGTYNIIFSKTGYVSDTIFGVNLQNGQLTNINLTLMGSNTVSFSGNVKDSNSADLSNSKVVLSSSNDVYNFTTDANGNFSQCNFVAGNYQITVGKWGFKTYCDSVTVNSGNNTVNIQLAKGYYDDFSLDFGWTVSGTCPNPWERGVPVETIDGGNGNAIANPGTDDAQDCSEEAFVTDNGGGLVYEHDVDPSGYTVLTSPVFDLSSYGIPYVSYTRWFYTAKLNGNNPNDTMNVYISNGNTTVLLEQMTKNTVGNGTWLKKNFKISDFISVTSAMQLSASISDAGPGGTIVEGGFDVFEISDSALSSVENLQSGENGISIYPNPNNGIFNVRWTMDNVRFKEIELKVYNILGEIIFSKQLSINNQQLTTNFPIGIYFVKIETPDGNIETIKFVKE